MIDQLVIGEKSSYTNFEASVKERVIHKPIKKSIKETVPFSNETYDFTAINNEIYWEERTLDYVFEILADSPEELENKKRKFLSWIMNVMSEELHDPFINDFHFLATFDSIDDDDSEIEKSTITVTFTAYPYMIANAETVYVVNLAAGNEVSVVIENNSSHRITPTFNSDVPFTLSRIGGTYSVPSGETKDDSFKLAVGENALTFAADETGTVNISFNEEVF